MNNIKQKSVKIIIVIAIFVSVILSSLYIGNHLGLERIYLFFDKINSSEFIQNNNEYKMCVHFLDVGKADCIYINCENKRILIDAADKDVSNSVVEYLFRENVNKLDLVVVTHPHRDHIGCRFRLRNY